MNRGGQSGQWRSERAERRFRSLEDELWHELVPCPPATRDLATRFGTTRTYHWPGAGEPVVLLHGMGGTSLMWAAVVGDLGGRDVYAVDTMGDVGRSVPSLAFGDCDDVAAWLDETLAGLGLARAHLGGSSYGAWMGMNLVLRRPGRVCSLALLDPAGMAPISRRFFTWGACVLGASLMPAPVRRRAAVRLRMPLLEDRRMMRMGLWPQINHPFRLPIQVLSDDDLRHLTVPVLLLIGERSEIYDGREVLARAEATMPDVDAMIIAGVGHTLPVDPRADAGRRIDEFLTRIVRR
jgi:pimeloyl-ACP methyl ester carboxylesterase